MFARTLNALVNGVVIAIFAQVTLAHPTSAQVHGNVETAVALGAYLPTRSLPLGADPLVCVRNEPNGPCLPFFLDAKRAVSVGGRVTAWLNSREAIEGSLGFSPSGVSGFVIDDVNDPGGMIMLSVRYVRSLAPHAPAMSALLLGGPALMLRFGDGEGAAAGGVFGISLDIHPGRRFSVRTGFEDYLYARSSAPYEYEFQQDLVLSLSISRFGPRGERR